MSTYEHPQAGFGADIPSYRADQIIQTGKDMHQIAAEMLQMDDQVNGLHQAIEELEARLSEIIRPADPANATSGPDIVMVPLASRLHERNREIGAARMRIVSILERLEL